VPVSAVGLSPPSPPGYFTFWAFLSRPEEMPVARGRSSSPIGGIFPPPPLWLGLRFWPALSFSIVIDNAPAGLV